ncbi:hypothetical protein SAMN04487974_101698 [Pelagibacterium luteolum]|uniref:Uncharacterized protein n=1 Tax=Pelagibacterium luteolum TaxID=440168 RepID=A0A1G7SSD1_9HYPH|nr:hypothetical protein SAMN04487974_101698 [Pelagibacterium luteolum]
MLGVRGWRWELIVAAEHTGPRVFARGDGLGEVGAVSPKNVENIVT